MKVKELIEELAKLPPEDVILAWDGDGRGCPSEQPPTIVVMYEHRSGGGPGSIRDGVWLIAGDQMAHDLGWPINAGAKR